MFFCLFFFYRFSPTVNLYRSHTGEILRENPGLSPNRQRRETRGTKKNKMCDLTKQHRKVGVEGKKNVLKKQFTGQTFGRFQHSFVVRVSFNPVIRSGPITEARLSHLGCRSNASVLTGHGDISFSL